MIDLHCHILPAIDDGAKNKEISLKMLAEQKRQGVKAITFTPHFNFNRIDVDRFVEVRQRSYESLMSDPQVSEMGIKFKLGCEVYFSTKLNETDLDPLCFEDSNYILIEFPTDQRPYGLKHTIVDILNRGYQPILAHVERYPYFTEDPEQLYNLIEKGCVAQINAGAVLQSDKAALRYIKWGMAQLICTDSHNVKNREPNLKEALRFVKKKYSEEYVDWFEKNARDVFKGRYVDEPMLKKPKKILGFWI